jgi:hypothetical protein
MSSKWTCGICTLENPARRRRCQACESRKPVDSDVPSSAASTPASTAVGESSATDEQQHQLEIVAGKPAIRKKQSPRDGVTPKRPQQQRRRKSTKKSNTSTRTPLVSAWRQQRKRKRGEKERHVRVRLLLREDDGSSSTTEGEDELLRQPLHAILPETEDFSVLSNDEILTKSKTQVMDNSGSLPSPDASSPEFNSQTIMKTSKSKLISISSKNISYSDISTLVVPLDPLEQAEKLKGSDELNGETVRQKQEEGPISNNNTASAGICQTNEPNRNCRDQGIIACTSTTTNKSPATSKGPTVDPTHRSPEATSQEPVLSTNNDESKTELDGLPGDAPRDDLSTSTKTMDTEGRQSCHTAVDASTSSELPRNMDATPQANNGFGNDNCQRDCKSASERQSSYLDEPSPLGSLKTQPEGTTGPQLVEFSCSSSEKGSPDDRPIRSVDNFTLDSCEKATQKAELCSHQGNDDGDNLHADEMTAPRREESLQQPSIDDKEGSETSPDTFRIAQSTLLGDHAGHACVGSRSAPEALPTSDAVLQDGGKDCFEHGLSSIFDSCFQQDRTSWSPTNKEHIFQRSTAGSLPSVCAAAGDASISVQQEKRCQESASELLASRHDVAVCKSKERNTTGSNPIDLGAEATMDSNATQTPMSHADMPQRNDTSETDGDNIEILRAQKQAQVTNQVSSRSQSAPEKATSIPSNTKKEITQPSSRSSSGADSWNANHESEHIPTAAKTPAETTLWQLSCEDESHHNSFMYTPPTSQLSQDDPASQQLKDKAVASVRGLSQAQQSGYNLHDQQGDTKLHFQDTSRPQHSSIILSDQASVASSVTSKTALSDSYSKSADLSSRGVRMAEATKDPVVHGSNCKTNDKTDCSQFKSSSPLLSAASQSKTLISDESGRAAGQTMPPVVQTETTKEQDVCFVTAGRNVPLKVSEEARAIVGRLFRTENTFDIGQPKQSVPDPLMRAIFHTAGKSATVTVSAESLARANSLLEDNPHQAPDQRGQKQTAPGAAFSTAVRKPNVHVTNHASAGANEILSSKATFIGHLQQKQMPVASGFQTAGKGSSITVSAESLARANSLLQGNQHQAKESSVEEKETRPCAAFFTAGGKSAIPVSDQSIARANEILSSMPGTKASSMSGHQQSREMPVASGFQTAGKGSSITVSAESLARANSLLQGNQHQAPDHTKESSVEEKEIRPCAAFFTAGGKSAIPVSDQSIARANEILSSMPGTKATSMSGHQQSREMPVASGFQTAGKGSSITVSAESLARANSLLQGNQHQAPDHTKESSVGEKETRPCAAFFTAGGKSAIPVSDQSIARANEILSSMPGTKATSMSGHQQSREMPVASGFQTAGKGSSITVSAESLARANSLLQGNQHQAADHTKESSVEEKETRPCAAFFTAGGKSAIPVSDQSIARANEILSSMPGTKATSMSGHQQSREMPVASGFQTAGKGSSITVSAESLARVNSLVQGNQHQAPDHTKESSVGEKETRPCAVFFTAGGKSATPISDQSIARANEILSSMPGTKATSMTWSSTIKRNASSFWFSDSRQGVINHSVC